MTPEKHLKLADRNACSSPISQTVKRKMKLVRLPESILMIVSLEQAQGIEAASGHWPTRHQDPLRSRGGWNTVGAILQAQTKCLSKKRKLGDSNFEFSRFVGVCVGSGKPEEDLRSRTPKWCGEYTSHVKAEKLFARLDAALYALRIAERMCARF